MKIRNYLKILAIVLVGLSFSGCNNNNLEKLTDSLDNRTVYLQPNQKLIDVDWRFLEVNDFFMSTRYQLSIWTLTREMTPQDSAITYTYSIPEHGNDYKITIIETQK